MVAVTWVAQAHMKERIAQIAQSGRVITAEDIHEAAAEYKQREEESMRTVRRRYF